MSEGQIPIPDRTVHEPARLAILTVLASCAAADFIFLQRITGLSKGNLSVQLVKLEQAGLITIRKEIIEKKTRTTARLSDEGLSAIDKYWKTMDEIRSRTENETRVPSRNGERHRFTVLPTAWPVRSILAAMF